jgi:hypothetical protein
MVAVRLNDASNLAARRNNPSVSLTPADSASRRGAWNVTFAGMAAIGFLNGSAHRALKALTEDPAGAIRGTFGISVIVWTALVAAVVFLWGGPDRDLARRDVVVAALALLLFLAPAAPLSWVGLTLVAVYLARTSAPGSRHRRGAIILFAVTVPMFWSRLAFSVIGDYLLRLDAALVALVTGAQRAGNAIAFADGWGYYWIAPACSSVANVSLAFLTYVLASEFPDRPGRIPTRYCLLAIGAVVAINIARMSVTGVSRAHYELMHGPAGTLLAGWLTLAAMVGICLFGASRKTPDA